MIQSSIPFPCLEHLAQCHTVEFFASRLKVRVRTPTMANVDQVSLPMRIALAACLVFAALWFVALRPRPVESVDGPLPTAAKPAATSSRKGTSLTARPAEARKAVDAANAATAAGEKTTAATGSAGAASTPATTAATPAATATATAPATAKTAPVKPQSTPAPAPSVSKRDDARAVLADIKAGRTTVLLVWDPSSHSSDDRAVRRAVSDIDRHDGAVRVHVATVDHLKGYETITKAAPIVQTPTVLIIDRNAEAHVVQGLTVTRELDDIVDRALKVEKAS